eukprot:PhM_4_TR16684/c0_g2_i1/m.96453
MMRSSPLLRLFSKGGQLTKAGAVGESKGAAMPPSFPPHEPSEEYLQREAEKAKKKSSAPYTIMKSATQRAQDVLLQPITSTPLLMKNEPLYNKKNPYLWLWHVAWSGAVNALLFFIFLRRFGFASDYARIKYISTSGDYRMLLEPGTTPDNPHLPPHLRLDKISYLDLPDTVITLPPWIDIRARREHILTTIDDMKKEARGESLDPTLMGNPNAMSVGRRQVQVTAEEYDRYVTRRMGMPKMTSEQRRKKARDDERRLEEATLKVQEGQMKSDHPMRFTPLRELISTDK